jgi:site-specific recombinase XerD
VPASSKTELSTLIDGYCLCAQSEAKSSKTIEMVRSSVRYLEEFLCNQGLSTDAADIGVSEIKIFIVHLQQKNRFSSHPYAKPQQGRLSGHTVNCYLRSIRAFWSWLVSEGIAETNPFTKVKIPKPPRKIIPTFSNHQLQTLINVINTSTPEGYRDMAVILVLLDTGLRVSELTSLTLTDVRLAEGVLKVSGKGRKERLIPIGKASQRVLWNYVTRYRPEPANPRCDLVFLTKDGWQLTKNRVQKMIDRYGKKASIKGVRCSPHTLRHTGAIMFLRNGGDVFTLQRLLGHASLEMTRHYCELADVDLKRAHSIASPVDNLNLGKQQFR